MRRTLGFVLLAGLAVAWAIGLNSVPVRAEKKKGNRVTIDGLTSVAPAEWKEEEPSELGKKFRVKQFRLPKVEKDKHDAEMVIFFFGAGSGGSVKDNVKRWQGFFIPPKGEKIADVTKVEKKKAGDVPLTCVDIHGTYKYKKAPFILDSKAELRPGYRMINVIFDSKNGPYWFRLVGPAKTIAHYKKGFDQFVKSFK